MWDLLKSTYLTFICNWKTNVELFYYFIGLQKFLVFWKKICNLLLPPFCKKQDSNKKKTRTNIVVSNGRYTFYQIHFIIHNLSNTIYPIPFIKCRLSNTFYQIPFIKYHLSNTIYQIPFAVKISNKINWWINESMNQLTECF